MGENTSHDPSEDYAWPAKSRATPKATHATCLNVQGRQEEGLSPGKPLAGQP